MAEAAPLRRARLDAERQALRARVVAFRRRLDEDRTALVDERERMIGPDSWLGNHPLATAAGSAAVGFAAGLAPTPRPDHIPVSAARKAYAKGASFGLNALKVEAGVIGRDIVSGMFGRGSSDKAGRA